MNPPPHPPLMGRPGQQIPPRLVLERAAGLHRGRAALPAAAPRAALQADQRAREELLPVPAGALLDCSSRVPVVPPLVQSDSELGQIFI